MIVEKELTKISDKLDELIGLVRLAADQIQSDDPVRVQLGAIQVEKSAHLADEIAKELEFRTKTRLR